MTDKDIFAEHPGLLLDDFRKDVQRLVGAEEKTALALLEHIHAHPNYEALIEEKNWVRLAEKTKSSIDDLLAIFRPVRYMAMVAMREETEPGELVQRLSERGVCETASPAVRQRLSDLVTALQPILQAADAETPPKLPGLRIRRMTTSSNLISEFENEFDTSLDKPESYVPRIRRLHAYTTLHLQFDDKEHEPITIAMTEAQLKQLVTWLQLAEVQQAAIKRQSVASHDEDKDKAAK